MSEKGSLLHMVTFDHKCCLETNSSNDCIQILKQELFNVCSQHCKGRTAISFVSRNGRTNYFWSGNDNLWWNNEGDCLMKCSVYQHYNKMLESMGPFSTEYCSVIFNKEVCFDTIAK